jgi:putative peptidoglycan lipid II flippase
MQDNLASRLDIGSVTALAYGWLIMQVPETIIGTAIGTAILPTLSEFFAKGKEDQFEASVVRAVRILLALTIPIAFLMMVGIRPLVQIAFNFDPDGTDLVVWAARAYLVGLVGHSLLEIGARAFYARQNPRIPLLAALISTASFFLLSIALFQPLGASGIGLSNSIAFSIEAIFLLLVLSRKFPAIIKQRRPLLRITAGSVLGGLITYACLQFLPFGLFLGAIVSFTFGSMAVIPFIWPELRQLTRL